MNFFLEIIYVVLYRYLFFFRLWRFSDPVARAFLTLMFL